MCNTSAGCYAQSDPRDNCCPDLLPLDCHGVDTTEGEDVRATPTMACQDRTVSMPNKVKNLLLVHANNWAAHLRQHSQLIAQGTHVIQEYEMQRPVRAWLRKVEREYTHW